MREPQFDWQVPPFTDSASDRMGYVNEMVEEAEGWLKGQAAYRDIPTALNIIAGNPDRKINETRSNLMTNHAKFAVRKIVAALADVKEIAIYGSDAQFYQPQAGMMNKVAKAVYLEGEFPRRLKMCLQYMSATGSGYIWPKFKKPNYGFGEGRVVFEPLGLLDVLPIQLPADNDIQQAYLCTIVSFMPVAEAHALFPAFQASLLPIARRRYTSTVSTRRLDLAERFRYGEATSENWANLYCEIRYTFIRDVSINTTGVKLPMGDPGASWYYEVPSFGSEIDGEVLPGGQRMKRKASEEDCLIYPNLRLIISSKGMRQPMYDGPAFDWHGMIPAVRYCADEWPWEASGYALTHDIHTIERARQELERGIHQVAKARLDPAMGYDRNSGLNDASAQTIDPYEARLRVGVDGDVSKVLSALLPPDLREVPAWIFEAIKYLLDAEDGQLGLNDIGNLANMKASINDVESFDKSLELIGPIVKDIAYGMESSTARIGQMLKFIIPQYYTTKRIMQYVGPDGITAQTLDFDPSSIVPSHGPDELENLSPETVIPAPSTYSKLERAKSVARNHRLVTVPHTLHEITQMQEQLKYLQLFRGGFPISPHDVAQKLNIENYGTIDGNTMFERWENWKKVELELAAKAQQLVASLQGDMAGVVNPQPQEPGTGPGGGQKKSGGRPPSGNAAPQLKQKMGPTGPRTTVTESK